MVATVNSTQPYFVRAEVTQNRRPYALSFQCKHLPSNPAMRKIFDHAVSGRAIDDMIPNPDRCDPEADKSHCGNRRGDLAECRCPVYDRLEKPSLRHQFENDVIEKIINHPTMRKAKMGKIPFEFHLAVFCSGRLLGEEILLFRLFDRLK
ncbi:MAG: hypothetical protein KAR79_06245, partial [Simkaniaceae bacterium]|nr:hypothetical protein [Simkaniaceae bacterium]